MNQKRHLIAMVLMVAFLGCARTPMIHWAALRGEEEKVALLLETGSKVDAVSNRGVTPLHLAAVNGHLEVAEVLLKNGADVNAKGKYDSTTPLHKAAQWGQLEMVKLLLEHGADINARNRDRQTPLFEAEFREEFAVAEYLRAQGGEL